MDEYTKAKKLAAALVAARMYTCREIFTRLCRKGISEDVAEKVVSDFCNAGILDDKAYAEAYVQDAISLGQKGAYRIKQELYSKGIASSIIDEACENAEVDTYSALCNYVEMHGLCDNVTSKNDLEKLKAQLVRRGFSLVEIKRCLSEYEFDFREMRG